MKYVKPVMTVESFDAEDLITTSLTVGGGQGPGGTIDFGDLH